MKFLFQFSLVLAFLCLIPTYTYSQNDSVLVKQCAKNYLFAFYQVKPELLVESVHPNLAKRTLKNYGNAGVYVKSSNREEMLLLAQIFNKDGRYSDKSHAEIIILDLYGDFASVKLVAEGWVDYMHLVKYNGKWQIVNILWFLINENPEP